MVHDCNRIVTGKCIVPVHTTFRERFFCLILPRFESPVTAKAENPGLSACIAGWQLACSSSRRLKTMTSLQSKQTPLEVLVFSQLAAIRRHEAALRTRISSGLPGASAGVAEELFKLQISTDRLNRLVNAMGN